MPTLNRFPLLGLWAREAAARIGYPAEECDVIGHAYAVLYAIRANSPSKPYHYKDADAKKAADKVKKENPAIEKLTFADDELNVSRTSEGVLVGRVGDAEPQTSQSYRYKIVKKYPEGWYEKVQEAMQEFFATYDTQKLDTRVVYTLYDNWKKSCAQGTLVDLEKVIAWCQKNKPK
jgi:hypothetical protein